MGLKFSEQHQVKYYECDVTGHLTLPMLLNIVIKTSEAQGISLGRSGSYVQAQGFGWVITQHEIHLTQLPRTDQIVTVTTQAKSYNRYFCYRSFWLHDQEGNELVRIDSTFVLMDFATRKMTSVVDEIIAPYECPKVTKIQRGTKLLPFESTAEREYRVRFSDIDANQHVNNSRYLDWMVDCLDYEVLTHRRPTFVNIRFDKEVSYGSLVEAQWQASTDETGAFVSQHQIKDGDVLCAEANITWQEV